MIRAHHLCKSYGGKNVVDDLCFEVGPREIVGFLGANGAGKTTTIRMLTGYLAPNSGTAIVAGHDISRDSLAARKKIGYMPENVPLYSEMRVKEYLRFRAGLKGMHGRKMRVRIGEVMNRCGIADVRKRLIRNLSKGYRQRLGIAEVLLNKPQLLILDEPSNGLDPMQIREVRKLIRELGEDRSVLLSTHILSEVEKTCDRVIIIDKSRKRASGTPAELIANHRSAGRMQLEVKAPEQELQELLKAMPVVRKISKTSNKDGWQELELIVESGKDIREQIASKLHEQNWLIRELSRKQATLEDAFVEITSEPEPGR